MAAQPQWQKPWRRAKQHRLPPLPKAWQGSENAIRTRTELSTERSRRTMNKARTENQRCDKEGDKQSGGEASRAGRSRSMRAALGHVQRVDKKTRKGDDTRSATPNYLPRAERVGQASAQGDALSLEIQVFIFFLDRPIECRIYESGRP